MIPLSSQPTPPPVPSAAPAGIGGDPSSSSAIAPAHPVAFVCHFLFKVAALVFYVLCESINKGQFVANFVVCIVLLAADFWTVSIDGRDEMMRDERDDERDDERGREGFPERRLFCHRPTTPPPDPPKKNPSTSTKKVKNVTGRLLVGLRWWNDASAGAEGGTAWRFESLAEGQRAIHPSERRWFWIVLVANPVLWALSVLSAFFGFDWGEMMMGDG